MSKETPPRRRRHDEPSKTSDAAQHDTANDLPLLMRDFELAVHNFHKTGSKLAEKDLRSFRESRKPIIGFLYILGALCFSPSPSPASSPCSPSASPWCV